MFISGYGQFDSCFYVYLFIWFIPPILIKYYLVIVISFVRPKIGNREKQQRKRGKYPKKLGKQQTKHEGTYREMGKHLGNCH